MNRRKFFSLLVGATVAPTIPEPANIPTSLDELERKTVIAQLVCSSPIARSEFLELYGFDYKRIVNKARNEKEDNSTG